MPGAKVAPLFINRDMIVRQIYDRLVQQLERYGELHAEPDPVHEMVTFSLNAPFMAAKPMQSHLRVSVLSTLPIEHPRIRKCTRFAPGRFYNQIELASPYDLDAEVISWITAAFRLAEDDFARQHPDQQPNQQPA